MRRWSARLESRRRNGRRGSRRRNGRGPRPSHGNPTRSAHAHRHRRGPPLAEAAGVVALCAALMRGGLAPQRALFVAVGEHGGSAAEEFARADAAGASPLEALRGQRAPEWRVIAAAWSLAERSGAPLAPTLERIGEALRGLRQLDERRTVLLAGPRATVRMVAALPPLALVLGALLGFDPVSVLLSPVGAVLLVLGSALHVTGIVWARSLSAAALREDRVAGLELELAWIVVHGGAAPREALVRVADCVDEFCVEWVGFDALRAGGQLRTAVAMSASVGVPIGSLLLEEAAAARTRAAAALESSAERLGIRVLIPLGVCVLPAFIVLGVLPVLISMLGGVA